MARPLCKIVAYFLILLLTGCTSTQIVDVFYPKYAQNFQCRRIIIKGNGLIAEKELVNALKGVAADYEVQLLNGMSIFPPTKEYSCKEMQKIAKQYSADSILIFGMKESTSSTYTPGTTSTDVYSCGSFSSVSVYSSPGYYITKTHIGICFRLINAENGETIWLAEGYGVGEDFESTICDICEETLSKLYLRHLLKKKKK